MNMGTRLAKFAVYLCIFCSFANVDPIRAQDLDSWDTTIARGKTRAIDFVTDEGTWMSVDTSPNGKWIIFDLLGHIYRLSSSGGEAENLTADSGIAVNYHPRYSPDGREIAFISDRGGQENLWVMNADGGSPRAIHLDINTRVAQPAWTPDSRFILAVQRQPTKTGFYIVRDHLWKYPREGGAGEELFSVSNLRLQWPSMGGDKRFVYFHSSQNYTQVYPKPLGDFFQLRRLNLTSGKMEDVTEAKWAYLSGIGRPAQPTKLGEMAPEVSPDGRYLAYARRFSDAAIAYRGHEYTVRTGLWLRDLKTGEERLVMDPITSDATDLLINHKRRVLPGYSWASDSKSLVISQGGKLRRLWIESGKVDTISFTARVQRTISEMVRARAKINDTFHPKGARWPVSSPDGKLLVFEAVGRLWLKKLPHGKPELLVSNSGDAFQMTPSWSHDGNWLTYVTWNDRDGGHVWKTSLDNRKSIRVSEAPGRYIYPKWGLDDRTIVVNRWPYSLDWVQTKPFWELVQFESSSVNAGLTIREPGAISDQRFGNNGVLYYVEASTGTTAGPFGGEGQNAIFGLNPATAEIDKLFTLSIQPRSIALSPDGEWMALQYKRDIYLAKSPDANTQLSVDREDLVRLSRKGGYFPHWRNNTTLEFVSADRYYTYDIRFGKLDAVNLELKVQRPLPSGEIAFVNARVVTLGNPKVIDRGTLVVRNNRIACVGKCDTSNSNKVIDARNKTIIPGWVDMHAHHNYAEAPPGFIDQHRFGQARYLAYGVTTTNDPGAQDPETTLAIGELTAAGNLLGPRTYFSETVNCMNLPGSIKKIENMRDAEDHVERNANRGTLLLKSYQQCNRVQRQMLVEAARKVGIGVTPESQGLNFVLGLIMDGHTGWEHFVQYVPTYRDFTTFAGQSGVHYSAQLYATAYPHNSAREYWAAESNIWEKPKLRRFGLWQRSVARRTFVKKPLREFPLGILAEAAADLTRAGGYYVTGAHSEVPGLDMHWEVWSYGLAATPLEALESASLSPAHFLGLEQEIGSLEPGKLADFMVLDANPLVDLRNTERIRYTMIGGRLYDSSTLDEVWPGNKSYGHRSWALDTMYRNDVRDVNYWDAQH